MREPTNQSEGEQEAEDSSSTRETKLSVNDWRTMRPRLAPRAPRIANSLERAAERARRRLERLTPAMRRIAPTADQNTISDWRSLPPMYCFSGTGTTAVFSRRRKTNVVYCSSIERGRRESIARAWARVMPGLRRPIGVMMLPQSRGGRRG